MDMNLSVRIKFWFYSNYWWIIAFSLIFTMCALIHLREQVATIATVAGILLSIAYFLQKQKLDEARMFRDLFNDFNARYDSMNEDLAKIVALPNEPLDDADRAKIIDYLNLCGEEYLYFRLGYIEPTVWSAWFNGMLFLLNSPKIRSVWSAEKVTNSYYGLPL